MTATGDPPAVLDAVGSGRVETAQVYLNVLNPSAGWAGTAPAGEPDFSGLLDRAAAADVGAIVIRSLAAGAVAGPAERHPNASDPFGSSVAGSDFARDQARAARLADLARELGLESTVELALRFVLAHRAVSTVIVGYSSLAHLEDALRWSERGPLAEEAVGRILAARPAA
jgi:aryl-alcohol dehydrogenase-like predicted oxidoreductase